MDRDPRATEEEVAEDAAGERENPPVETDDETGEPVEQDWGAP
ncbi:MAG TPA: hypothetical protein VN200_06145 [Rhodoglobus sp.]|nr:hypothetical protein [Rhodoglobus sp.]